MLSPRLDPRVLVVLLRGLSAGRLGLAVLCGLLVLPAHPESVGLTWGAFLPVGVALWYVAFACIDALRLAVEVAEVRKAAHTAIGFGVLWVAWTLPPITWLFAWAALTAIVYTLAGAVSRRRVAARIL